MIQIVVHKYNKTQCRWPYISELAKENSLFEYKTFEIYIFNCHICKCVHLLLAFHISEQKQLLASVTFYVLVVGDNANFTIGGLKSLLFYGQNLLSFTFSRTPTWQDMGKDHMLPHSLWIFLSSCLVYRENSIMYKRNISESKSLSLEQL